MKDHHSLSPEKFGKKADHILGIQFLQI